ncbi:fimbria/pilus outer membrane usher protein [Klebsiella pneumoniae]|uniref:fimbria/pilus outer membrane usher protein n=1 Tax=Klebsiella pneumoniae TaxID=573 RepID=UPI0024164DA5|nr:fimbria/pilus outer membrane usher protein [Klebsiella pneumoniae]
MGWQGSKGSINAGYGHSHNITGGAIAHSEGLTLSRTLGSSMALVSAPDASGVRCTDQRQWRNRLAGFCRCALPF